MNALQLRKLEDYCDFSDPSAIYILLLIPRKKENKSQKEREKLKHRIRYIVQNMDDVNYALKEFTKYTDMYADTIFRIYVSVNRRSLMKGMINFQQRMLEFNKDIMCGHTQSWIPIAKLGSEFKSILAKKESKYDKNWMFDVDLSNTNREDIAIVELFKKHLDEITTVLYYGESKSGFAIVIKPCNPNDIKMPAHVELKRDSYLYIDCIND